MVSKNYDLDDVLFVVLKCVLPVLCLRVSVSILCWNVFFFFFLLNCLCMSLSVFFFFVFFRILQYNYTVPIVKRVLHGLHQQCRRSLLFSIYNSIRETVATARSGSRPFCFNLIIAPTKLIYFVPANSNEATGFTLLCLDC